VGLELGPLSLVSTIEQLFERENSDSSLENQDCRCRGSATLTTWHPISAKVGTNVSDKRQSLGRYSWLAGYSHRVVIIKISKTRSIYAVRYEWRNKSVIKNWVEWSSTAISDSSINSPHMSDEWSVSSFWNVT
jgi:hypothetical protein